MGGGNLCVCDRERKGGALAAREKGGSAVYV